MRIAQELFTVFANSAAREVVILLGGLRIALSIDEARQLTGQLANGIEEIVQADRSRSDTRLPEAAKPQHDSTAERPAEPAAQEDLAEKAKTHRSLREMLMRETQKMNESGNFPHARAIGGND